MNDDRNERLRVQRRLIGLLGEKNLASADVATCTSGFSEIVEARYLVGAGVGSLRVRAVDAMVSGRSIDPSAHVVLEELGLNEVRRPDDQAWTSAEAYAFYEGAASALRTLKEAMASDVPGGR